MQVDRSQEETRMSPLCAGQSNATSSAVRFIGTCLPIYFAPSAITAAAPAATAATAAAAAATAAVSMMMPITMLITITWMLIDDLTAFVLIRFFPCYDYAVAEATPQARIAPMTLMRVRITLSSSYLAQASGTGSRMRMALKRLNDRLLRHVEFRPSVIIIVFSAGENAAWSRRQIHSGSPLACGTVSAVTQDL